MNNIQYVHYGPYAVSKTITIITVQFSIFIFFKILFLRDLIPPKYIDSPHLTTCSVIVQSDTGTERGARAGLQLVLIVIVALSLR